MSFVVPGKIHLQLGMKHVIWTGQVVNNNFNSLHHKTLKVVILPNKNIKKFINGNYLIITGIIFKEKISSLQKKILIS